jgi:hypothetical protein
MNTITRIALGMIAVGTLFGAAVSANADQYASELSNPFTKHGLPVPGAYFKAREDRAPTTIAVTKSGKGVGEQKQTVSKPAKKPAN